MNAIEVLESQEARLEDLFHEISLARDPSTMRLIFDELADDLAVLSAMEANTRRRLLLARPADSSPHSGRRVHIDQLLSELRGAALASETFSQRLATLQDEVEQEFDHIDYKLCPLLMNTFEDEALWTLGAELIAIRRAFEMRAKHYPPASLSHAVVAGHAALAAGPAAVAA